MKLISWNVNGLRAVLKKGFLATFTALDADIFCIQETKMHEGQAEVNTPGYYQYFNYAERKGYSGTAVFTKYKPLAVTYGIAPYFDDDEGRVITLEFPKFFLVTCYTPNSGGELKRLDYRTEWDEAFRAYVSHLDKTKPVIFCGDLNVAHEEIDLKNPTNNHHNAGFTDQERVGFSVLLKDRFLDSFRHFHPTKVMYSWWSYRFAARSRNAGWRIDYFCYSQRLQPEITDAQILTTILGSDHCPVELDTTDALKPVETEEKAGAPQA